MGFSLVGWWFRCRYKLHAIELCAIEKAWFTFNCAQLIPGIRAQRGWSLLCMGLFSTFLMQPFPTPECPNDSRWMRKFEHDQEIHSRGAAAARQPGLLCGLFH